jgi:hypothetical protein
MKTRRSKIANDMLILVKTFFEGAEFKNRPERIKEYIRWALRAGGPVYYETPVPKLCVLRLNDPDCPVSFFTIGDPWLTVHIRNQMGICARSLFFRLPRHTQTSRQGQSSVPLWDQGAHQRASMQSF